MEANGATTGSPAVGSGARAASEAEPGPEAPDQSARQALEPAVGWHQAEPAEAQAPTEPVNEAAQLPQFHQSLLRGAYMDMCTGEWLPYFIGQLKSYSHRNGYGFMRCTQAYEAWGCDVFIHKNNLPQPWLMGQYAEFAVFLNDRLQPQAADVLWLPQLPGNNQVVSSQGGRSTGMYGNHGYTASANLHGASPGPMGTWDASGASDPAKAAALAIVSSAAVPASVPAAAHEAENAAPGSSEGAGPTAPVRAPPGLSAPSASPAAAMAAATGAPLGAAVFADGTRFMGTLKSFSMDQGFGFIACPELWVMYSRDVYVEKSQLPVRRWVIGQAVEFAVSHNAHGLPQAKKVDWDPVPMMEAEEPRPGAPPPARQKYEAATVAELSRLLKKLQEGDIEGATIKAIDLQSEDACTAGGVDFVSFILDRLAAPEVVVSQIKDLVQMLLLLMLSRMLRRRSARHQYKRLIQWFELLADAINQFKVSEHFGGVARDICKHANSGVVASLETEDPEACAAFRAGVQKIRSKWRALSSSSGGGAKPPGREAWDGGVLTL